MNICVQNKDHVLALIGFYQRLLSNVAIADLSPIVYGSLAYYAYTRDESVTINDIDVLIKGEDFTALTIALDTLELRYEVTDYASIKVFDRELKIAFDAKENYLSDLSDAADKVRFGGHVLRIINKQSLIEAYRRGAQTIPFKQELYTQKLKRLLTTT